MPQFLPLIFICALSVAHSDCNARTARIVTAGAVVANEMMCPQQAQYTLGAAPGVAPKPGEYAKFTCKKLPTEGALSQP